MKLAILGGGGFRVPLIYRVLLTDHVHPRIDDVVLYDTDRERAATIAAVLAEQGRGHEDAPHVSMTGELAVALRGADFVFCAVRVGGAAGRAVDEEVALDHGVLGQETTGAGGISFALRTVPVAIGFAEAIAEICPHSWVINFTNPAGIVTEAMQAVLGDRVIGICDSPTALVHRATRALGLPVDTVHADYVGLNHLGWLRGLSDGESELLPGLLVDPDRLGCVEEARLFGPDWVRSLRAIPNEYLYFYYDTREAMTAIRDAPCTRGQFLVEQQRRFYERAKALSDGVLALWQHTRQQRNETYMAELRDAAETGERDQIDVDEGGYETIALRLMTSLMRNEPQRLILNVRNGPTVPGMPTDGVIEVPCDVDGEGARPVTLAVPTPHQRGLMLQVKAVEQLTIEAARAGSRDTARLALALHPLVDSFPVAGQLLEDYLQRSAELAAALPG